MVFLGGGGRVLEGECMWGRCEVTLHEAEGRGRLLGRVIYLFVL